MKKVVLITGASSGIGRATAQEFAKLGYHVAVTGRNQARLDEVLLEMVAATRDSGEQNNSPDTNHFLTIQADFEDEKQVDLVMDRVIEKFNRLDILINNAGYVGQSLTIMDDDFFADFQKILQVNLMASMRLAQLAVPHLAKHTIEDPGIVINISSVADRLALQAMSYCISKAGLTMLTKTLANSLEGRPVRVLAISPGPISTKISPDERVIEYMGNHAALLGRTGSALEVANLIVFLASDKASYMHGCSVDIDGGLMSKLGLLVTDGMGKVLS